MTARLISVGLIGLVLLSNYASCGWLVLHHADQALIPVAASLLGQMLVGVVVCIAGIDTVSRHHKVLLLLSIVSGALPRLAHLDIVYLVAASGVSFYAITTIVSCLCTTSEVFRLSRLRLRRIVAGSSVALGICGVGLLVVRWH